MAGFARDRRAVSWRPETTNRAVVVVAVGIDMDTGRMGVFYLASHV